MKLVVDIELCSLYVYLQVPENFQARETFDAVHDLIITKPKLYNRLISV